MPSGRPLLLLALTAVLLLVARAGWSGEPPGDEPKPAGEDGAAKDAAGRRTLRVVWEGRVAPPGSVELELQSRLDDEARVRITVPTGQGVVLPAGFRAPRVLDAYIGTWRMDQRMPEVERDASNGYVVRLDVPGRTTLVVRGVDGKPVQGVEVQEGRSVFDVASPPPGVHAHHDAILRAGADGRIELPMTCVSRLWWVRAAAHVPRAVRTSPDLQTVDVELQPAGALDIRIRSEAPLPSHVVRVSREAPRDEQNPQRFVAERRRHGRYGLDGVPIGRWTVTISAPEVHQHDEAWASAEVEVVAGTETVVVLDVPGHAMPGMGELVLLVHLPAAWGLAPRAILEGWSSAVAGIELPEAAGEAIDADTWRYVWPSVRAGRYRATIREPRLLTWVEAAARGKPHHIHVPPPRELVLEVRDAISGEPVTEARVSATSHIEAPSEATTSHGDDLAATSQASLGLFAKRLPLGPYQVTVHAPGYAPWDQRVELEAGEAPLRLSARLERGGRITVRFAQRGRPAPPGRYQVWWYDAAEGSLFPTTASTESSTLALDTLKPGTYVLSVSGPNVETSRTQRVTIKAGEHRIIVFDVGG